MATAEVTAPPYAYTPLTNPERQIRLLRILPEASLADGDEERISCELTVHDREEGGLKYVAISYTWGDAQNAKTIEVNGLQLSVGFNCWYALWQMRTATRMQAVVENGIAESERRFCYHESNFYWIDGVCINQDSLQEKSAQVQQMGSIYAGARRVAACIGTSAELINPWLIVRPTHAARIAKMPYFARLWTVQERLHARELAVFSGDALISWIRLKQACINATARTHWDGNWLDVKETFRTANGANDRKHSTWTLDDLILHYGHRQCLDHRDRIYGLLSLLPATNQAMWQIDYSISLLSLFERFTASPTPHDSNKSHSLGQDVRTRLSAIRVLAEEFAQDADFCSDLRAAYQRSNKQMRSGLFFGGFTGQETGSFGPVSCKAETLLHYPPPMEIHASPSVARYFPSPMEHSLRSSLADAAWFVTTSRPNEEIPYMGSDRSGVTVIPDFAQEGDTFLSFGFDFKDTDGLVLDFNSLCLVCSPAAEDGQARLKGYARRLDRPGLIRPNTSQCKKRVSDLVQCSLHLHPQDVLSIALFFYDSRSCGSVYSIRAHSSSYVRISFASRPEEVWTTCGTFSFEMEDSV